MENMNGKIDETMKFKVESTAVEPREVILTVHNALKIKGYNAISQFVGYILSGDPSYITAHDNARSLIGKLERDEILEELVSDYIKNNG